MQKMSSAEREQYNRFCFFVKVGCSQSPRQKRLYLSHPFLYKSEAFEPFDEAKIIRHDEAEDYPIIMSLNEKKGYVVCLLSSINKAWDKQKGFETTPQHCLWCGAVLPENEKGRTRLYCDESCKRKDIQFRKKYLEMIQKASPEDVYEFLKLQRIPFENKRDIRHVGCSESDMALIPEDKRERAFYILTQLYLDGIINHQSIMATLRGNCKRCGKPIPIDKPMNAQYCCDECSSRGRKLKYYHSKKEES